MDKLELKATNRDILGKKVSSLRRKGITPIHVFGRGIKSEALQCPAAELQRVLAQAGRTRLISFRVGKDKEPRNVMVREVQRDPVTGTLLHVDLYQVKMEEKMKVKIPIVLVGEAAALKSKENMLAQELNDLNVECLPGNIPNRIEVDVSSLSELGQSVRVKDIAALGEGIAILDDAEVVVARVARRMEKEEVVEKVAVAPEVAEAAEAAKEAAPPAEESKEE